VESRFAVGNAEMLSALARLKSYFDYGTFQPIQIAAIIALNEDQGCVRQTVEEYKKRRDTLIQGLIRVGWEIEKPKGTNVCLAEIPKPFKKVGSIEFTKYLLREGKVAVSPGSVLVNMERLVGLHWWRTSPYRLSRGLGSTQEGSVRG